MKEPLPTILASDSPVARTVRPLLGGSRVLRGAIVEDLQAIEEEIRELHEEARRVLEDAQHRAAEIEERAKKDGYRDGIAECTEQLASARAEHEKLRQQAEQDMVTLAFHIARRLIGHAIEVEPMVVRDIVGEALVTARGRRQILLRIHPDDLEVVEKNRDDYARELDGVPVQFEADASLERGGCVIDTESGRIDARLETQLAVLREALLNEGSIDS